MRCGIVFGCFVLAAQPGVAHTAEQSPAARAEERLAEAEKLAARAERLAEDAEYDAALPLARASLAIRQHVLGRRHPDVAPALSLLGEVHKELGDYTRAASLLERAWAINKEALGPGHPEVALVRSALGMVYLHQGDYEQAQLHLEQALDICRKTLGPEHPDFALALNNLAGLLTQTGDYERAASLGERALDIVKNAQGPAHPNVATALNQLATVHWYLGEYDRAAPLYERALAILKHALGPDHPDVARALSNLAIASYNLGKHAQATAHFERALAIEEKALGPDHPGVAISLNHVGNMYGEQGEYERALPLFERALDIQEAALGPDHPDVAVTLTNLATLHHRRGQPETAVPLLERTLDIQETVLGPDHPEVAFSLAELAVMHREVGDIERAGQYWRRNSAVREKNLQILLATGSEDEKRARLANMREETHGIVSFHQRDAPGDPRAARLALETILRRKGRVLDAVADSIETLRQTLDDQARGLLDELGRVRSALATRFVSGPEGDPAGYRARNRALRERMDALEDALGKRSRRYRAATAAVTVEDVQARLAGDAALVELFRYQPYAPPAHPGPAEDRWQAPRYAAYVLRSEGAPRAVDLGEAAPIDALVGTWRAAFRDPPPGAPDAREHARALDARLMAPVRPLLGGARRVFIAPDGALNLIPFAALVDESDRYLIERYTITYVTSGRDLIRLGSPVPARQGPVILADPRFGAAPPRTSAGAQAAGATDVLAGIQVRPLPATAREAEALARRLADVEVWTGARATEARLAGVHGPVLLHIATHGVWLRDAVAAPAGSTGHTSAPLAGPWAQAIADPMLRAGLPLAGFNRRQSGEDDGLLTALEAASLDLYGTELVVLSACDTGLGEVKSGQGVYGLRRALVVAGARTQVMSLWQVDDAATRDLMLAYYDRLLAGQGRSQAMRQAQLALVRRDETAHPYFWAGFIVAGDPSPMTGLVPRPASPAGCSPLATSTSPARPAAIIAALVALAAMVRLRRRRTSAVRR